MKTSLGLALFAAAITLVSAGCGPVVEEGPSYAELVVTYNAELEALDRLEKKRTEMVANYERTLRPSPEDALKALGDVLNSSAAASPYAAEGLAADPNEMLDQAVANAVNVQEATSQLLAAAAEQASAERGDRVSIESLYSDEFKGELAALDEEIAKQQARVDRARQARDAAEPR